MKKTTLLLILFAITFTLKAQNKTIEDNRLKKQILYGKITLEAFQKDICKNWYNPEYNNYTPRVKILSKLQNESFNNINITVIFGSWCHDSHREVPRFIKILKELKFPFSQLTLNALDTYKHSPDFDTKANNINKVPTIIVYCNGNEIGRIIETPRISLEKDLLKILN